jgi:hypothetical protein
MPGTDAMMMLLMATVGALVAAVLSLVPGLHIYSVAGFVVLAASAPGDVLPREHLGMLFLGMITGYAMLY